jgi:hypothetical protein
MPAAKQTAGYPSVGAAVRAMMADGLNAEEICARTGKPRKLVSVFMSKERRRSGKTSPLFADRRLAAVSVHRETLEELRPHADRRGVSAAVLARRLIELVAADDMVDAILDDLPSQGRTPGPQRERGQGAPARARPAREATQ